MTNSKKACLIFLLIALGTFFNVKLTVAQPGPQPISPPDGATDQSTNITFEWEEINNAEEYQIQVSTDESFSESSIIHSASTSSTTYTYSALSYSTTYYWRVRSGITFFGDTFYSDWSEAYNFTTQRPPPEQVQLNNPTNGAEQVSSSPTLDWQPADRANVYDIQVATDQNFNQIVADINNHNGTNYNAQLTGFATYYWRVRGDNGTGPGDWSQTWNFTTQQSGNAISIRNPSSGDFLNATETIPIRWRTSNNITNVNIEYRLSTNASWVTIADNVDAQNRQYNWDPPDESSSKTQLKISASNADIETLSEQFILYPDSIDMQHSYSFNSARSASDFQLIGLPGQSNIPVDQLMSGRAGDNWNAYYDNGNSEDYMIEFDNSQNFTFKPGHALFVISKSKLNISTSAPSMKLSSDTTVTIPLHSGWNMIASPFDVNISWTGVQAKNNISAPLWGFQGKFTQTNVMEAYNGYYFFNQQGLNELAVPYRPARESQQKYRTHVLKNDNTKDLKLKLKQDGRVISSVEVGFDQSLNDNESSQQFAPPGNFQDHKLTITSQKFEGRKNNLAEKYLPPSDSKQTFLLNLQSKKLESVMIESEGSDDFLNYEIRMINKQTSKSINLKQKDQAVLNPDQTETHYLLVIGTEQAVKNTQEETSPQKVTLSQNYPNPFNGQTTIEYSVPKHMGQTEVQLDLFDILGRRVYTLVNSQQQPGFYDVHWNGEQETGRSLASGVYYYRLRIGETVLSKKLTLIK